MNKILLALFTCFIFQACSNEKTKTVATKMPEMKLICQEETSTMEATPAHSVHLNFNGEKIKLANILACKTFSKDTYQQHQMPENTMQAVGGWWAGAGEYFYLAPIGNDNYAVKYGQMYEEKETKKYDYTELIRIQKDATGKYIAKPKHQLKDLVGVYTLGGHDTSWMLIIKPKGPDVEATYYPIEGMIPPIDFLQKNPIPAKGQVLKNFDVDFSDMVIESDLGTGQLETIFGRERITFFNIKSHLEDMLRVTKDESLGFLIEK